ETGRGATKNVRLDIGCRAWTLQGHAAQIFLPIRLGKSGGHSTTPGAMPLTVTSGASSRARLSVRFTNAALLAQYARYSGQGRSTSRSIMLTTCPRAARSIGASDWASNSGDS